MNKKRLNLTKFRLIVSITCIFMVLGLVYLMILVSTSSTSFVSENFPLSSKWTRRLDSNIVYISAIEDQIVLVRTVSKLYALDNKSGTIVWEQNVAGVSTDLPALAQNGIVFLSSGDDVLALNQSNGEVLWKQSFRYPPDVVAVSQDIVAIAKAPQLKIYQAKTGSFLWETETCRNQIQAYIYGSNIYIFCYGIKAMDISSGRIIWETKAKDRPYAEAYSGTIMYSSADERNVVAYDLENRVELWSTALRNDGVREFKIVDNFLFLTDQHQFCTLQKNEGKTLWCVNDRLPLQNPVKIKDVVYIFGSPQKVIKAYNVSTGTQIGQLALQNLHLSFTLFYWHLMASSDELLIFASGQEVFAFAE